MVNMNAAGDKQNQSYRLILETNTLSRRTENSENSQDTSQSKLNGNSSSVVVEKEIFSTASGSFPKHNAVQCCSGLGSEDSLPSTSKRASPSQILLGNQNSSLMKNMCKENKKEILLENKKNRPSEIDCVNQANPRGRQIFNYDENSSSEDEECCIYTYKGDANQMADLPSSFFRLDYKSSKPNGNSRNSSPDMDYLEMDFDPGPSNGRDSSSNSECGEVLQEDVLAVDVSSFSTLHVNCEQITPEPATEPEIVTPTPTPLSTPSPVWNTRPRFSPDQPSSSGCVDYSRSLTPESQPSVPEAICEVLPTSRGEQQPLNSYCFCGSSALLSEAIDENFNDGESGTMIWKEEEAKDKQVNQIGTSLCGATAVINALLALNVPYSLSALKQALNTRFRSESAQLPEYLMSRCNAGTTHIDMICGLQTVSNDTVFAKFFHMYPQRCISLATWLSYWIKKGAVPILTLNTQRSGAIEVADFWHHQMVYGVSARGVHLTNPHETQTEARLWPQLASPPLLLIRREDVLSRWTPDTALHSLANPTLPAWRGLNVLGQVVNVVREGKSNNQSARHITIPASYSSGVTLAMLRSNPACDELRLSPQLPVDPFAPR